MWALLVYVGWLWFLSKPLYSVLGHFFWTSMELAAIRDPNAYDAAVSFLAGGR